MSEVLARLIEKPVGPSFEFGGYRVARSTTHISDHEIFEFRYRIFVDSGYIDPRTFREALLRDEFDDIATQITVRDSSGALVGAARFVSPTPIGFHVQRLFDFDLPSMDRTRLAEFGRLAVRNDHRGGDRTVMLALLKAFFECMIQNQTTHVLAFLSPQLADSFAALGCKSAALVTREPDEGLLANRSAMRGYFESQNPLPVLYDLQRMMVEVGVRRSAITELLSRERDKHSKAGSPNKNETERNPLVGYDVRSLPKTS